MFLLSQEWEARLTHEDELRNGRFNFWYFSPLALAYLMRFSRTLQSWTKLTENLDPSPLMGKWCVLAFVWLHPWFWGDNCLLVLYIPPKIAPPPPPPKNRIKDGKIARFGLRAAQSLISVEWVFAVSFFWPTESQSLHFNCLCRQ